MRSLADIIAFNAANADRALRFGQDIFLAAEATRGDLSELEYLSARQMDLRASRQLGLDAYMDAHRLDAVLFPGSAGASIAAKAGYPSVQVPGRLRRRAGHDRTRPTIPTARPLPAGPGASPSSCASPTPSSRRPRRAARRPISGR